MSAPPVRRAAEELVRRFLEIESVAIVGASERQHHTRALTDCLASCGIGEERVFYVSPTNPDVHGRKTVASLSDLAVVPSLVFSLVPARFVPGVLREAGELGVHAFVSIADGFADAGEEGRELQQQVVAIAAEHDVSVLGPNTLGYLAPGYGVGAWVGDWSQMGLPPMRSGPISIVGQSSGMLNIVLQLAAHRRIGIRAAVSVGNEAVVDAAQFVEAFAEDEESSVIGVILESTSRPRALAAALLRAREREKRVLVFKFGSSEIGRRNALSHSGRLASPGRVWAALFDKLGIAVASDFDEFLDGLSLAAKLATAGYDGHGDLGFLTVSGGDVGLVSDLCEQIGVPLAPLTAETRARLLAVEGNVTHAASNPLDLGLIGHRLEVLDGIADAVFADDGVGLVGSRLALPWRFSERAVALYETLARRSAEHHKALAVVTRAAEPLEGAWYDFFAANDIAALSAYGSGLRTLAVVIGLFREHGEFADWTPSALPEQVAPADGEVLLDWHETQSLLADWGVSHVAAEVVDDRTAAAGAAARLGYPVCVKGLLPGIVHKAEVGLVRIGIADDDALERACEEIARSAKTLPQEGELRFELQPLLPIASELLLGMVRDPLLGPVVTIGAGGGGVERLGDVAFLLPPYNDREILAAIGRLRIGGELLAGLASSTREALVALVRAFGAGVASDARLTQVDLNPVVITRDGVVTAVDAVAIVNKGGSGDR